MFGNNQIDRLLAVKAVAVGNKIKGNDFRLVEIKDSDFLEVEEELKVVCGIGNEGLRLCWAIPSKMEAEPKRGQKSTEDSQRGVLAKVLANPFGHSLEINLCSLRKNPFSNNQPILAGKRGRSSGGFRTLK